MTDKIAHIVDTEQVPNRIKNYQSKKRRGGRNLVILGVASTLIAFATTGVSLAVYHNSGDVYLDRSRPGFLPDEAEMEEDEILENEYTFSKSGYLSLDELDEYLKMLKIEIEEIDIEKDAFSAGVLSNENLGIPEDSK